MSDEPQPGWKSDWWIQELASDPAYDEVVTPLVRALLEASPGVRYLDVGCGEGRVARAVAVNGSIVVGVDASIELLRQSGLGAVAHRLPSLRCFVDSAFDGAYVSLVFEHIADHEMLLAELARVVKVGGVFAAVLNHPIFTAPGSAPIVEPDGETLWRPGSYFDSGYTDGDVGGGTVRFHHRPLGEFLTTAALAGWDLQRLVEFGVSDAQVDRLPLLGGQRHIPRLLGARWARRAKPSAVNLVP